MRKLTFKTFLQRYCCQLTGLETESLLKFASVLDDNPRAEEPVLLYALYNKRNQEFFKRQLRPDLLEKYKVLQDDFKNYESVEELAKNSSVDFVKVFNAYQSRLNETNSYSFEKKTYCEGLNKLLKEKNLTSYRVSKDLGLCYSNVHYFLKGNLDRLSLDNCEMILDYLRN